MSNLRPQQIEISTGAIDNDTVTTKGYVDESGRSPLVSVNDQTGTTYTLTETDLNGLVTVTNASDIVVTMPEDSTEDLDDGFYTTVVRGGGSELSVVTEGSDSFQNAYNTNTINAQNASVTLIKRGSGDWYGYGDFDTFEPTEISGLEAWYDGDDVDTITFNGSDVAQWDDKSGNNRDVAQATPAEQPLYVTNSLNGRSGLEFDGVATNLVDTFSLSQPLTYYLVGKFDTIPGSTFPAFYFGTTSTDDARFFELSGNWYIFAGTGLSSSGGADTNPHYFRNEYNSTSGKIIVDGSQVASGNVGTTGTTALTIGRNPNTNQPLDGKIYELLIFSKILSADEIAQMDTYLKIKWGF